MKRLVWAAFLAVGLVAGMALTRAQTPTKQLPCPNPSQVYVLAPGEIADKVKELNAAGFCLNKSNFLVVGDKVVLLADTSDLYAPDEETDEDGHAPHVDISSGETP